MQYMAGTEFNTIKTSAIMFMTKQMIENRDWKEVRGLSEDILCRVFSDHGETAISVGWMRNVSKQ